MKIKIYYKLIILYLNYSSPPHCYTLPLFSKYTRRESIFQFVFFLCFVFNLCKNATIDPDFQYFSKILTIPLFMHSLLPPTISLLVINPFHGVPLQLRHAHTDTRTHLPPMQTILIHRNIFRQLCYGQVWWGWGAGRMPCHSLWADCVAFEENVCCCILLLWQGIDLSGELFNGCEMSFAFWKIIFLKETYPTPPPAPSKSCTHSYCIKKLIIYTPSSH